MKINGMDIRTWLSGITVTCMIILGIVGYIYAEATASRLRDSNMKSYVVSEDKAIRKEIYDGQKAQMEVLNRIDKKVALVQKDVEHIKENGYGYR